MKKLILFGILVLCFVSCDPVSKAYAVYIVTGYYSDLELDAELSDGSYIKIEVSDEEFKQLRKIRGINSILKVWSGFVIQDWLVGNGFDYSESLTVLDWLSTRKHGMIVARDGIYVHMLVK